MHDHHSPHRLQSEHALSLSYDEWLTLKNHEHLLATHHHRQQTLRNTVLTLFRQYQADTAYLCWWDEKRRQGWWDEQVEEEREEGADASAYHFRVGSEAYHQSSTPEFLRWAALKRRQEQEERRILREQQEEQKRREDEEAKEKHERAQAEYSKWHTTKAEQLTHRRAQQHAKQAAQETASQRSKAAQQLKAAELYQQWTQDKTTEQLQHARRQQRRQQRRKAAKLVKQKQFEALYPEAIAQYVATVQKWRKEDQLARQRQADRERARTVGGGRAVKKAAAGTQSSTAAVWGPASLLDLQTASSTRLSAGKRADGIKLPFAASTASTAAMSASARSAASLFDSFSSSSSSSTSAGPTPSAIVQSTARSTASEPVRRIRASTQKRRVASRPPWNDDTTVSISA